MELGAGGGVEGDRRLGDGVATCRVLDELYERERGMSFGLKSLRPLDEEKAEMSSALRVRRWGQLN
jgi:hypothetical protein